MNLSLDAESPLSRFSRWSMESGGLRASSILLLGALYTSAASAFALMTGVRIDAAAIGLTLCARDTEPLRGLVLACGLGYLAELYSGQPHGLWMFGASVAYAVLRVVLVRLVSHRASTVVALAALATLVAAAARGLLGASVGQPAGGAAAALGSTLATALVAYPGYRLMRLVSDRFRRRDDARFRGP